MGLLLEHVASRGAACFFMMALAQFFAAAPAAHAQTETTAMEKEARAVIETFYAAWNAADNDGLRKVMNFPFVSMLGGGRVTVSQTAADFTTDFDRMRRSERWHHSTLDAFEAMSVSPDTVHCKVTFSRFHEDGTKYMTMTMLYIVTRQNGHWGMQFRSPWNGK